MGSNLFSDEVAFSVARPSSYERGKEYFEDGCVEKIWEEEEEYRALVRGTQVYEVSMSFRDGDELKYQCSCPYEGDGACKHIVASILKFSTDVRITKQDEPKKNHKNTVDLSGLVATAEPYQIKSFLEKTLIKDPQLVDDFKIFLQGQEQTPITVSDYKMRFRRRLDKLDLKDLLGAWYIQGEDYYGDGYETSDPDELGNVISELTYSGREYEENGNFGEALKIYQAMFETLGQMRTSLKGDLADLSDLFDSQISEVIDEYIQSLAKVQIPTIKEIGISCLAALFQNPVFNDTQDQVAKGLQRVITTRQEAMYLLEHLGALPKRANIYSPESSLLAFLYHLLGDEKAFEETSLNNLEINPGLALNLLKFYWKKGLKEKVLEVSGRVLKVLTGFERFDDNFFYMSGSHGHKDIEIEIRRFLKDILFPQSDYNISIDNLERLFFATGSLGDYKEAAKSFLTTGEKEQFWQKIKKQFSNECEAKIVFKVFELEDQKAEVLGLIKKFPHSECFPEMVTLVQGVFPTECFAQYRSKIEELLKIPKTENYPIAVRFLKKMQKIEMPKEFADYLNYIKTAYGRRPRLIEELHKL